MTVINSAGRGGERANDLGDSPAVPSSSAPSSSAPSSSAPLNPSYDLSNAKIAGPLQKFLEEDSVEEIWINGPNRIFLARHGKSELAPLIISSQEIRDIVERMLAWSGRRVDLSQPFVDARLPNGARLHVVIPDITSEYWTVNIRKKAIPAFALNDLVAAETISDDVAELLRILVNSGGNLLISGATQAGKTTVLNCLLGELPVSARLITIEEVFELTPRVADHVGLQTRQPNLEGSGEVNLRMLVKESLRMRPTHLVIGEVRGAESLDLLLALNSGVPGMASIHANSSLDALKKLSALPLLAGINIGHPFAIDAVRSNIDAVIHCAKDSRGARRIIDISLVEKESSNSRLHTNSVLSWSGNEHQFAMIDFDLHPKFNAVHDFVRQQRRALPIGSKSRVLEET